MAIRPDPEPTPVDLSDAFRQQVEVVLDHFGDPAWLGRHSPLAQPYVLGAAMPAGTPGAPEAVAHAQGMALAERVRAAAETLAKPGEKQDLLALIKHSYLDRDRALNLAGVAMRLGYQGDTKTFYNHRAKAVSLLSQALARQLRPGAAHGPAAGAEWIGRPAMPARALELLQTGCSVSVMGGGGLGKSTLLAHCARHWPGGRAFVHTFRKGFNTHVGGFLHALGAFLAQHGEQGLWAQLLITPNLSLPVAQALISNALQALHAQPVLLCIDEVDLLVPADDEPTDHASLRGLIEALIALPRAGSALALAGQQALFETDEALVLDGLDDDETLQLVAGWGLALQPLEARHVRRFTRGNPLLLRLFAGLHRSGEPIQHALDAIARAPNVQIVLARLRKKLDVTEDALLDQLAVFRDGAPADAWPAGPADRLVALGLIERGAGRVMLLPALRGIVAASLAPEARTAAHLAAGQVMAARARYTEAAFHLERAGRREHALWLWSAHREHELASGCAAAALEIISDIARSDLADARDRDELARVRAELLRYAGRLDHAAGELRQIAQPRADDRLAEGMLARLLGRSDEALERYRSGVSELRAQRATLEADLLIAQARALRGRGNLDEAWHDVRAARFALCELEGSLHQLSGELALARAQYAAAHELARALGDAARIATAQWALARVNTLSGDAATALAQYADAEAALEASGDLLKLMAVRSDHAGALIVHGDPAGAAHIARQALAFAQSTQSTEWIARTAANLAEAELMLGETAQAVLHANLALDQREPSVQPYALLVLAQAAHERGDPALARRHLDACITAARAAQDSHALAQAEQARLVFG